MVTRDEIAAFIKNFVGTRSELNSALKRLYKVQLVNTGKYKPHQGLRQRVRVLKKQGKTMDEIEVILFGEEVAYEPQDDTGRETESGLQDVHG